MVQRAWPRLDWCELPGITYAGPSIYAFGLAQVEVRDAGGFLGGCRTDLWTSRASRLELRGDFGSDARRIH